MGQGAHLHFSEAQDDHSHSSNAMILNSLNFTLMSPTYIPSIVFCYKGILTFKI
jgi:hypothetical protein